MFPNNKDSVPVSLLDLYSRQAGSLRSLFPTSSSQGNRPCPRPLDRAMMNQFLVQILTEALEISEEVQLDLPEDKYSSSNQ